MGKSKIGEKGEGTMLSIASRAMNMEGDIELIKKYDEYSSRRNPIFYVIILFLAISIVSSVILFKNANWIWGALLSIISLLLFLFARSLGNPLLTKRIAYESGLLIPAIITNTSPLEIVAMADMRAEDDIEPLWGLIKMQIKSIPNHTIANGEKVPCVALFGMATKGYRRHFEPRPLAWAFSDKSIIYQAQEKINDVVELSGNRISKEWELLYTLSEKMTNQPYKEVLFFDNNLEIKKL